MKVTIDHKETQKKGGFFSKPVTEYKCEVHVEFSEEEKAIIDTRRLDSEIVLERQLPDWLAKNIAENLKSNIVDEAWIEKTKSDYHVTIGKLRKFPDNASSTFPTPAAAKKYEEEIVAGLKNLKAYLEANATVSTGPKTIEI